MKSLSEPSTPDEERVCQPFSSRKTSLSQRHSLLITCLCLTGAAFIGLAVFAAWTSQGETSSHVDVLFNLPQEAVIDDHPPIHVEPVLEPVVEYDPYDTSYFVNGPPMPSFFDNLRNDTRYITSWLSAGWTNDVMTYANLIYLGIISERVPIVGPFIGSHHIDVVEPFFFGDIFDLPRLRRTIHAPIIEWRDVKQPDSPVLDTFGAWSVWVGVEGDTRPRHSWVEHVLNLDISYTAAPWWIKMYRGSSDVHSTFWSLASLGFPKPRSESLDKPPVPSPHGGVSLPPDERLLCFDYLYYVGAHASFEYEWDFSPAWRFVLQHMRWHPLVEKHTNDYLRRAFGVHESDPTPPYIAIHARHEDFQKDCGNFELHQCFAPLSAYNRRVAEIQKELLETRGIDVKHVIVTSDETNATWWKEVADLGWSRLDQERATVELGKWYTVFMDAVAQSNGIGFIGTPGSTMSLIAGRRVQSWHNGTVRMVNWGRPGADEEG